MTRIGQDEVTHAVTECDLVLIIKSWLLMFGISSGNAKRFCVSNGQWGEVNVLNCTSRVFVELEETLVSFG